jgi:hypothetical protein
MRRAVPAPPARPLPAPGRRPAVRSAPVLISPFPARRAAPRDAAGAPRSHKPTVRRQPAIRQSHHPDEISRDELKDARPESTPALPTLWKHDVRLTQTWGQPPQRRGDHNSNRRWTDGSVLRSQPVIALVILVERLDDERRQWYVGVTSQLVPHDLRGVAGDARLFVTWARLASGSSRRIYTSKSKPPAQIPIAPS